MFDVLHEGAYSTTGEAKIVDVPTAGRDAFGRLRISDTGNRLDAEFIYDKHPDLFDERTNNGTVTHNVNTRDLTLSISDANNGTYSEMRSHPVPYTPGNSQLIDMTGVLDLADIGGGTAEVFLRSKISGTVTDLVTATQANWNNPVSDVDWSLSHIFQIDFQSLKVGRVRFSMNRSGECVCVHQIVNDNLRNSGYWQSPTLPVYWKVYNDATYTYMELGYGDENNAVGFRYKISANASATMKAICATVKSESGLDLRNMQGVPYAIDRGVTAKTVSTSIVPLLSIRPRSTYQSLDNLVISLPKSISVTMDNPIKLIVLHDAVLTGASWANVDTSNSSMEYDVSATTYTGGHIIYSEYVSTTKNTFSSGNSLLGRTVMWNRKNGDTGIITIAAVRTSGTDASCLASINWEEIK